MPTATLKNVVPAPWWYGRGRLAGNVYGHPNFPDGAPIITSRVVRDLGNIAVTLNTVYVLKGR